MNYLPIIYLLQIDKLIFKLIIKVIIKVIVEVILREVILRDVKMNQFKFKTLKILVKICNKNSKNYIKINIINKTNKINKIKINNLKLRFNFKMIKIEPIKRHKMVRIRIEIRMEMKMI